MPFDSIRAEIELAWEHHTRTPRELHREQAKLRRQMAEAQNWRCCYCGCEMVDTQSYHPRYATREHIVPRSKGGAEFDPDNLVVACRSCNTGRGDAMWPEHFAVTEFLAGFR